MQNLAFINEISKEYLDLHLVYYMKNLPSKRFLNFAHMKNNVGWDTVGHGSTRPVFIGNCRQSGYFENTQ